MEVDFRPTYVVNVTAGVTNKRCVDDSHSHCVFVTRRHIIAEDTAMSIFDSTTMCTNLGYSLTAVLHDRAFRMYVLPREETEACRGLCDERIHRRQKMDEVVAASFCRHNLIVDGHDW